MRTGPALSFLATLAILGAATEEELGESGPRLNSPPEKKPVSFRWVKGRCVRVSAADLQKEEK